MHGIAGIVYPDAYQMNHLIPPMLNAMSHRGQEQREIRTFRNMQIGICGSSFSSDKRVIAGLDGTLYNSKELRKVLQAQGCQIIGETHAELLVHSYELWGSSFLEHIQGDFAIVLLDQEKGRILLARDRIGKQPLYWFHNQHHFVFASELKAILASGVVPQTPATDAISSYLYFGYTPQDMTPIKDVNKLLPGHYLEFNRNRSKVIQSYWSYSSYFQHQSNEETSAQISHFDTLFRDSLTKLIPEQRPLGCFVSGGLGSSAVAYYLQQIIPKEQLRTYSVEFKDETSADMKAANEIADSLHLQHDCQTITPQDFLNDLVKITWYLDEPLADPNVIATWKLSQMASRSKVVFSGMGSDELLAGHCRYTIEERKISTLDKLIQSSMPWIKRFCIPLLTAIYKPGIYPILQKSRSHLWQLDYLHQNALFTPEVLAAAAPRIANLFDPRVFLHKFYNISKIPSTVSSFLYFDVKTRLVDCFILQYERLTTANSLDWRSPFLAQNLVEYLAGMLEPDNLAEKETALFLKAILKDVYPPSVVNRPKKSRKDFLKPWVENSELAALFKMLPKGILVESGLISGKWLREQTTSPQRRRESFRYLWSILALEIWFRLFIHRSVCSRSIEISVRDLLSEN